MTKYLKQLILALTIFSSANTWAVCTNEDLTGFWDYLEAGDDYAVQCSLRFDGKKVTLHRFGCNFYGNLGNSEVTEVDGTLTVDEYCHVKGSFFLTINGGRLESKVLNATLNQSRTTIHAIFQVSNTYAPVTMVKFY
jgi:hypothetical protein